MIYDERRWFLSRGEERRRRDEPSQRRELAPEPEPTRAAKCSQRRAEASGGELPKGERSGRGPGVRAPVPPPRASGARRGVGGSAWRLVYRGRERLAGAFGRRAFGARCSTLAGARRLGGGRGGLAPSELEDLHPHAEQVEVLAQGELRACPRGAGERVSGAEGARQRAGSRRGVAFHFQFRVGLPLLVQSADPTQPVQRCKPAAVWTRPRSAPPRLLAGAAVRR